MASIWLLWYRISVISPNILNQFSNTSSFVADGELITLNNSDSNFELEGHNIPTKLFCGFVNWFGHIIKLRGRDIQFPFYCDNIIGPCPYWGWYAHASPFAR